MTKEIICYLVPNIPFSLHPAHDQTEGVISFPESLFQKGTISFSHSQSALGKVQILPGRGSASGNSARGPKHHPCCSKEVADSKI